MTKGRAKNIFEWLVPLDTPKLEPHVSLRQIECGGMTEKVDMDIMTRDSFDRRRAPSFAAHQKTNTFHPAPRSLRKVEADKVSVNEQYSSIWSLSVICMQIWNRRRR